MKIDSPLFGPLDIAEEHIIEFPQGLPGFEECRRFTAVHEAGSDQTVFLLQCVDDPAVAFSITAPECLGVNFVFELSDEETDLLRLSSPDKATVAVIVRKDASGDDSPASTGLRANYMAPIVMNVEARRGLQKVFSRVDWDVTVRARA